MRKLRRHERGATLLEGAVTALLFFSLILGVIEFGRAYNQYQVMTNAAREGARYSVAPDAGTANLPTITEVQTRVQRFLDSAGIRGASVQVCPDGGDPTCAGTSSTVNGITVEYRQVRVTAPYTFFFFRFATVNMGAVARMRDETSP